MTGSTLERMLGVFDVTPLGPDRFAGNSDYGDGDSGDWHGEGRRVVDGSQILAQSLVAAGKALPGRPSGWAVRSAHALFVSVADPAVPLEFAVVPVRAGRSFASAVVTVTQDGRTRATSTVLLDSPQPDVIRHDHPAMCPSGPPAAGPDAAYPAEMPMRGRQLRIEGVRDYGNPDETGPPVLDAWLRYDIVPARDDLRRALLAHFTGHLSISAAMRPHPGIGTALAHRAVSTAVMGIGVSFHDPVGWDGWIRYHHESTFAGAGMAYVRGQVLTADGRLLASFTQDAMIRALEPAAASVPGASRL